MNNCYFFQHNLLKYNLKQIEDEFKNNESEILGDSDE